MTPDPLPVALPELPTVAWLVEFGAVSLPKGHPSRITAFEAHHSEADALDSAHCLEYDSLVFEVVHKSDAEAALRAQAEEVAALRADAERYRWLRDKAISRLCIDHTRDMYDGGNRLELVVPIAQRYSQEDDVTLDAAIDAHIASEQGQP